MPSPHCAVRLLTAALLCAAVLATPAHAAAEGWKVAPSGDGRPYFYLEGAAGTVLEDKLSLTNSSSKPRTLKLRGAHNTRTGAWIALAADEVKIPPRTRAEVPFTVTVPQSATPGDHPGTIVASGGGREAGVRVHLRVSGPRLAALTVEDITISEQTIHYALVNRGNTALTPSLTVHADGLFGEVLHRKARTLRLNLLPGRRVELTESWPDAPALDSVDVRLTATAPGAAPAASTASATFVPWTPVTLTALLAGAAAVRFVRRSPAYPTTETATPERHLAKAGAAT
ncbi:hypothetical protein [Streptomyces spiramyceticus]|uniref:COG1470 family protein n=1 Tax=Streptomyces spiramyceticus TaxID=299717 RepID=UPI00237ADFD2|nr:hypothetical protein [Streptomyces spiramyceticus]